MRYFLFAFLFFFSYAESFSQTGKLDVLKTRLAYAKTDNEKLDLLLLIGEEHQSINKDSFLIYANTATALAEKQQDDVKKIKAQIAVINACLRLGKTDAALSLSETALKNTPVSNPLKRPLYFQLAGLKADCYGDQSDYKAALAELYKVVAEAETYNDSAVLAKNMNTIGVINYNLDHVPEAFSWYFRGIAYTGFHNNFSKERAALFINISDAYRWIEKTDSASYYIDSAVVMCRQVQNLFFLSNALRIKGSIYKKLKNFSAAEQTMLDCIAINERTDGKAVYSNELLSLASIYVKAGEPDKAIPILTKAMEKPFSDSVQDPLRISYLESLAASYQLKNDTKNYTSTLENLIEAKDAFYKANSAAAIAELQTKYEVQKKESTIIKQKLDITQKNYILYGSFALLVFSLVLTWLLFANYRRRQQQKTTKALYEEKLLSATAVQAAEENERKRVAADLHDNLGAYAASISSNVDHISRKLYDEEFTAPIAELKNNSQAIVSSLADTIWALKKTSLSLTVISDRVKAFIQRLRPSYPQLSIEVAEDISNDRVLPPAQAFHLFRIVQEAINNSIRHSACKNITIHINSDMQGWSIEIVDDGKGFNEEVLSKSENGVLNIKNRAAEFGWQVHWEANEPGTIVSVKPTTN